MLNIASALIDKLGLAGIALGVFLNGLGVPGLSEVLLPLGGVAIHQGTMDLVTVFAVAMIAQIVGVSAAYGIARSGGLPLIEKYGRYILISKRELDASERAFEKYGGRLVVVGAFVPGIQGFIGYAAGVARMNFGWFLLNVFIGKLVWVGALVYVGMVVGGNLDVIDNAMKQVGAAVLALLLAAGLWYLYHHKRRRRKGETHEA